MDGVPLAGVGLGVLSRQTPDPVQRGWVGL